jgi:hypothetical protein
LAACALAVAVTAGIVVAGGGTVRVHSTPETDVGSSGPDSPNARPSRDDAPVTQVAPTTSSLLPAGTAVPEVEGPDLEAPTEGHEITFEGVGVVRLGDVLDPSAIASHEGGSCGYWGPIEPAHDGGDEPLRGLALGADTAAPTVATIQVVRNKSYRTASGVGVGTTLGALQGIYGDRLVVDLRDGWEHSTDGLLASYQDVAAVRHGARALTFLLRDGRVQAVKLSDAAFWGDDEGCV